MMIRILVIFLILIVGLYVGPLMMGNQGLVLLQLAGYRIKMSFISFVLLISLFLLFLYTIYWIVKKICNSKTTIGRWLQSKSPRKAAKQLELTQLALLEGDFHKAGNLLSKSAKLSPNKTITYLQAAQAKIDSNKLTDARDMLEKSLKTLTEKEKFAFYLVQLRLKIKNGEYESAKQHITKLLAEKPRHPEVLKLADQLYYLTKDYQAIIGILPAMYKVQVYPEAQLEQFKNVAYIKRIQQLSENQSSSEQLLVWWKEQPRAVRHNVLYQKQMSYHLERLDDLVTARKLFKATVS